MDAPGRGRDSGFERSLETEPRRSSIRRLVDQHHSDIPFGCRAAASRRRRSGTAPTQRCAHRPGTFGSCRSAAQQGEHHGGRGLRPHGVRQPGRHVDEAALAGLMDVSVEGKRQLAA